MNKGTAGETDVSPAQRYRARIRLRRRLGLGGAEQRRAAREEALMLEDQELTQAEHQLLATLNKEQRPAFMIARNKAQCAHRRMKAAELLPPEALRSIGDGICRAELKRRGITV